MVTTLMNYERVIKFTDHSMLVSIGVGCASWNLDHTRCTNFGLGYLRYITFISKFIYYFSLRRNWLTNSFKSLLSSIWSY